jgi:hypothetical protein
VCVCVCVCVCVQLGSQRHTERHTETEKGKEIQVREHKLILEIASVVLEPQEVTP